MPMHPRPRAETVRLPSFRRSMGKPYHIFAPKKSDGTARRNRRTGEASVGDGAVGDVRTNHRATDERRHTSGGRGARAAGLTHCAAGPARAGHSGICITTGATETHVAGAGVAGAAAALAVGAASRALATGGRDRAREPGHALHDARVGGARRAAGLVFAAAGAAHSRYVHGSVATRAT